MRGRVAGLASGVCVHDCSADRCHHLVADRGDRRHRHRRLSRQLAVSAILQGGLVRSNGPDGRARRDQRRRLRVADHPRHHPGQHECAADERGPCQGRCAHHQGPHARRHRGRLLCSRRADARGRGAGRRDPWPAHDGTGATARSPVRQVHLGAALGRLRDEHGGDARAAGRLPAARQGGRCRGAGAERSGARDRGADRSRPDRFAVLQPVEPLRCRRLDQADRRDRGPAQVAQRHRAGTR